MSYLSWQPYLAKLLHALRDFRRPGTRNGQNSSTRLQLEPLEDRRVMSGGSVAEPAGAAVSIQSIMGPTTSTDGFLDGLYHDLLGRMADPSGFAHWKKLIEAGVSRGDIVQDIQGSPEYFTKLVQNAYKKFLHRDPEPAGLQHWLQFLNRGGTPDDLRAAILGSDEYFQERCGGTSIGFISTLYADLFHRPVDSAGEAIWRGPFLNGAAREGVVRALLHSDEWRQTEIDAAFQSLLHRHADSGGLEHFIAALRRGASISDVQTAVAKSEEFLSRHQAVPATLAATDIGGAQDQLSIDGRTYTLKPDLWRNFMPIITYGTTTSEYDRPLYAFVTLAAIDRQHPSDALVIDHIWVTKAGDPTWETNVINEDHGWQGTARNGPTWPIGTSVDVVVRVVDGEHSYFLRSSAQVIQEVD